VDEWFACQFLDQHLASSNPGSATFSTLNNLEKVINSH